MSSLSELLANKKSNLKTNSDGISVRTKDGLYREYMKDGVLIRELIRRFDGFVPIEGAPDPEVCKIDDYLFLGSQGLICIFAVILHIQRCCSKFRRVT